MDDVPLNQEDALERLRIWASLDRDTLVRDAYRLGVTKYQISIITGIARSTIDRILRRSESDSR